MHIPREETSGGFFMPRFSFAAIAWAAFYLVVWGGSVVVLKSAPGEAAEEAIVVGVIFGVIAPLLAWGLTLAGRSEAMKTPIPVARPAVETWAVVGYLVLYAVLLLGWGLSAVREWFPDEPARTLAADGLKILAHVVLPAALLAFLGAKLAPLFRAHAKGLGFWLPLIVLGVALIALQGVISPSLKRINELNLELADWAWAGPGAILWLILTVGLCEEFLFRAVLQSRLTAFLKSATGAVAIGAILFGLAHAPGLFMRADPGEFGAFQDPLYVAAYTIAVLSPTGIFFGVLWARTQSLWLLVLLHVCIDFLPNLPRFVQSFGPTISGG